MKIALIRYHDNDNINTRLPASLNKIRGVMPPLGIAYIAAVLERAGHCVKIIDAQALNLIAEDLRKILRDEKPDIAGVTAMISNSRGALEAAKIAKECNIVTVLGGPLLHLYSKEVLSYDFVDYAIAGEAEYAMLDLVKALDGKTSPYSIKGLIYRKDGQICMNEPGIIEELDELPLPARHLLPIEKYSSIINRYPVTTMIASRGCPYDCGFCIKGPSDKKYRVRKASNVVDEMEMLVSKYKLKEIMFYDDTLTLDRKFVVSLCNEILNRGLDIKWESPTRIDRVDKELLRLMKKAGCMRLRYGVESGDAQILKLMNKRIELSRVKDVFNWTRQAGIETFAYFIIGYVHETPQTIMNTISVAKELDPDLAMFTVATPYPTTPLCDMAESEGLVDKHYWKEFVLGLRNDRLPYMVPDADVWVKRAYRSFYLRLAYIIRSLLKVRSLHDIKRYIQAAQGIVGFKVSEYKEA